MLNVLLEQLQNIIAKTFSSGQISLRSSSDDGNKNSMLIKLGY